MVMPRVRAWKVLRSTKLIERWWMTLRVDHVQLANGVELEEFHVMEYPDWSCVICRTEDDDVVLVEQYRHAIRQGILELPAGGVASGEDPLEAAKRELKEETGYVAPRWEYLGTFATEPSRHTNRVHMYFAAGARKIAEPSPDHSEELHVLTMRTSRFRRLVDDGQWVHGVQLGAILLAERRGLLESA